MPKEIDARLSERIRQAVDEGFEEQVAFTADLVRENAFLLCKALRDLEAQWNDERSNHPLFADLEHPIVINVGKIEGGDWTSWCLPGAGSKFGSASIPAGKREWVTSEIERSLLEAAAHEPLTDPVPKMAMLDPALGLSTLNTAPAPVCAPQPSGARISPLCWHLTNNVLDGIMISPSMKCTRGRRG